MDSSPVNRSQMPCELRLPQSGKWRISGQILRCESAGLPQTQAPAGLRIFSSSLGGKLVIKETKG